MSQPWYREALGACFRFLVRTIVPLGVSDSQVGFKLFTAPPAEKIFKLQKIERWAFDVELLAIARRQGIAITELPIIWHNDRDSKMRLRGMLNMLCEVLQIRLNLWRDLYDYQE